MKEILKRIDRALSSLKLTALTIASLITIYFLGLVTPQKWMFDSRGQYDQWLAKGILYRALDAIGFTDIYMSPLTLALLGLFFVNLLVVMVHRTPKVLRRAYIGQRPVINAEAIKSGAEELTSPHGIEQSLAIAGRELRKEGFRVMAEGADALAAIKNRLSPIGFLLFHYSFLLCLIGGALIFYTRFSGKLPLTEGQAFKGDIKQFRVVEREPRGMKKLPQLGLELDKVRPRYDKGVPSALDAEVLVYYDGVEKREAMDVNEPIRRGPYSILVDDLGVSPLVEMSGPDGQVVDSAYVALNVFGGEKDSFKLNDERYNFTVLFYPDYAIEDGLEISRSPELNNPVFHFLIQREGAAVYDGTVRVGQEVSFDTFTVRVMDIRYWVEFIVVREYGVIPLIAGFIMVAMGLVMRLVFYQKRLNVLVESRGAGSIIYISGRSEFFPFSYKEEMGRLGSRLNKMLLEVEA